MSGLSPPLMVKFVKEIYCWVIEVQEIQHPYGPAVVILLFAGGHAKNIMSCLNGAKT